MRPKPTTPDHLRPTVQEPYPVEDFAAKHGITVAAAGEIVGRYGDDRRSCDKAAKRLKNGLPEPRSKKSKATAPGRAPGD